MVIYKSKQCHYHSAMPLSPVICLPSCSSDTELGQIEFTNIKSMRPANVRICTIQYTPLTYQRLTYENRVHMDILLSCQQGSNGGFYIRKLLAAIAWSKVRVLNWNDRALYGIFSTCIGSLDPQKSSRNREILAAKMASTERDMCQDHSQAWMALRLRYIEGVDCIGLFSREHAPLHTCHTFTSWLLLRV